MPLPRAAKAANHPEVEDTTMAELPPPAEDFWLVAHPTGIKCLPKLWALQCQA